MGKDIKIKWVETMTPAEIEVDGVKYPRTQWNIDVVMEYWNTKDESMLDKLKNFSLEL
jgi:hypothetical protein